MTSRIEQDNKRLLRGLTVRKPFKALTGKADGTAVEYREGGSIVPGRIWVHSADSRQDYVVLNNRVQMQPKIPVFVGPNPDGKLSIIDINVESGSQIYGEALGAVSTPPAAAEVLMEPVVTKRIKSLRLSVVSGLSVRIDSGWYEKDESKAYFAGSTIDLSTAYATITSGNHAWLLIVLDVSDGTLNTVVGTQVSTITPLQFEDIPSITLGADEFAIWAIDATHGDTDINAIFQTRVYDVRPFFSLISPIPKNNFAASTAPTANDDSDDGYSVGSTWIDTTNDKFYRCVDATVSSAVWIEVVGTNTTQTLTNKTLTTPTIGDFTNAGHNHENAAGGGTLDVAAITSGEFGTARLADSAVTTAKINNGAVTEDKLDATVDLQAVYGNGNIIDITNSANPVQIESSTGDDDDVMLEIINNSAATGFSVTGGGDIVTAQIDANGFVFADGFISSDQFLALGGSRDAGPVTARLDVGSDNAADDGRITMRRARNTNASPSAVNSNDFIGRMLGQAHNGTNYQTTATLSMQATQNQSGSAEGTQFIIQSTEDDATSLTNSLLIQGTVVAPGGNATHDLGVSGTAEWDNVYAVSVTQSCDENKKEDIIDIPPAIAYRITQRIDAKSYRRKPIIIPEQMHTFTHYEEVLSEVFEEREVIEIDSEGNWVKRKRRKAKPVLAPVFDEDGNQIRDKLGKPVLRPRIRRRVEVQYAPAHTITKNERYINPMAQDIVAAFAAEGRDAFDDGVVKRNSDDSLSVKLDAIWALTMHGNKHRDAIIANMRDELETLKTQLNGLLGRLN